MCTAAYTHFTRKHPLCWRPHSEIKVRKMPSSYTMMLQPTQQTPLRVKDVLRSWRWEGVSTPSLFSQLCSVFTPYTTVKQNYVSKLMWFACLLTMASVNIPHLIKFTSTATCFQTYILHFLRCHILKK
jgi:hypothetical protein